MTISNGLNLDGKSILITGGTGSFGQQLAKTVLDNYAPERLIIFSRDEQKQYEMAQELSQTEHPAIRYFIGDVRDVDRLEMAMRGVDYVVHAAALKHVPTAEYNPFECIHTNVHGAENIVKATMRTQVERVIALSTDKAANPINLYGASKLASDKIFVAANNLSGSKDTRFSVVRYGNVLGSRGSVLPFFRKLVAQGAKALPITDERMTRFWITLEQGVEFVLKSLANMQGGEIFVPKIPSMKIVDFARCIAPDVPIEIIGVRPGEKLHEVLVTADDARSALEFDECFLIPPTTVHKFSDLTYRFAGQTGRPTAEGFQYRSDNNEWWLSIEDMRELMNGQLDHAA